MIAVGEYRKSKREIVHDLVDEKDYGVHSICVGAASKVCFFFIFKMVFHSKPTKHVGAALSVLAGCAGADCC